MSENQGSKTTAEEWLPRVLQESGLWLLWALAALIMLSLLTFSTEDPGWSYAGEVERWQNAAGPAGAWMADVLLTLFGVFGYLLPVLVAVLGYLLLKHQGALRRDLLWFSLKACGLLLLLSAGTALVHLYLPYLGADLPAGGGGLLGLFLGKEFHQIFNSAGGGLMLFTLLLVGVTLVSGLSWFRVMDVIGGWTLDLLGWLLPRLRGLFRGRAIAPVAPPPQERVEPVLVADGMPPRQADVEPAVFEGAPRASDAAAERGPEDATPAPPSIVPRFIQKKTAEQGAESPDAGDATLPPYRLDPSEIATESAASDSGQAAPALQQDDEVGMAHEQAQQAPVMAPQQAVAAETPAAAVVTVEAERSPLPSPVEATMTAPAAPQAESVSRPPPSAGPFFPFEDEPDEMEEDEDRSSQVEIDASDPVAPAPSGGNAVVHQGMIRHMEAQDHSGDFPEVGLLDKPKNSGKGFTEEELENMAREVELRLADFGVTAEVTDVFPGPVVVLFELQLAPGTKVSKITGLAKDLARALSTISVRVVEIIPGKSVIGLEVPNQQREIVYLSEILESEAYQKAVSPVTLAMGKDIAGRAVVADLAKMPHALIAGTTGSGKSVAINVVILSILYKARPEDVRLIMVDPKMLELSVYEGIPHLLTPVVTDMKEAANALRWCVGEMERRYRLMAAMGVRNLAGFNRKIEEANARGEQIPDPVYMKAAGAGQLALSDVPMLEKMPMIVVVIDELADMMMVVGKKVEELIARLAQKARASGIHLLLATQRPSVDVLTGLIKANIPTRIAFQVSSRVDSRTVLDQMGAEQLLGHGDMLYLPPGTSIPRRVHGAFVDDHEVHAVVEFLKQTGAPDYIDDILSDSQEEIPGISNDFAASEGSEDQDPLYDEAVRIVTETRRASISGVQRRLSIGYNRAARMIEEMERSGIVAPPERNGNREVLAPPPPEV